MAISQAADVQHDPMSDAQPATRKNSPLTYGLGALGSMAIGQAFGGYYQFYYVDVLGLAVALLATVNVVYGIWDIVDNASPDHLTAHNARIGSLAPWLCVPSPVAGPSSTNPSHLVGGETSPMPNRPRQPPHT